MTTPPLLLHAPEYTLHPGGTALTSAPPTLPLHPERSFRPDDGTDLGRALADLNALLAVAPTVPGVTVARAVTFLSGAPAWLNLEDHLGAPVELTLDLVVLDGIPAAKPIAERVAASLLNHRED